jgi:hypothetical protein
MPAMESTFHCSKQVLVTAVLLSHPASKATFALVADASRTHIPATSEGRLTTMGFLSRKLSLAELRYSTFRYILEGQDFQLWTGHNLLVTAFIGISKLICQLAS